MNVTELQSRLSSLGVVLAADGDRLRVKTARGQLSRELQDAIREHRLELLRIYGDRDQRGPRRPERLKGGVPPLSFFQERLWVLHRLDPDDTSFNMAVLWPGSDRYSVGNVLAAIRDVVSRHAILRSTIIERNGEPQLQVLSPDKVPIEVRYRSQIDERGYGGLESAITAAVHRAFDLAIEPPARFQVWEIAHCQVAVLISAHHIALDAWSIRLLGEELQAACEQLIGSATPAPTTQPLQYGDFAVWQRAEFDRQMIAAQLDWWENRLVGSPQLCVFPPDVLPGERDKAGAVHSFTLNAELTDRIRALGQAEGATVYMVLIAVCSLVLSVYTGQEDIVLGSPMGTRERSEFEPIIGPFVNLLVLRLGLSEKATFSTLLRSARDVVLDAHAHRDVPFELLIERMKPIRSLNHHPMFQVAVVLHNEKAYVGAPIHSGGSIHDFTWFVRDNGGPLECTLEYRSDLYTPKTIERIADHLERALFIVSNDSQIEVGNVSLISESERRQVIEVFNDTTAAVDPANVHVQIERQVARTPEAIALRFGDVQLSYDELNKRANQLARYLALSGVGPGTLVGVCIDHSPELIIALIAVLKSGGAYVPLDPGLPAERLRFMLADSGAKVVVVSTQTKSVLTICDGVTSIDLSAAKTIENIDVSDLQISVSQMDPAYLIYTSGSTGKPKGVQVSHGALSNFLGAMLREPGLGSNDVVASLTTVSFDIAGLELYLPLLVGARVELISREISTDGAALAASVESKKITTLQATPTTLGLLAASGWHGQRDLRVFCGGEPLPRDLASWLFERVGQLWNLYGPTETTIWSTAGRVESSADRISIGRPIANTQVYVVDRNGEPVAIGLPGEIWIGGAGVATGYHARPDLTELSFIPNRLTKSGGRLYRTGDLGRWDIDGRLYHLGRNDDQVKINGVRMELGEIESVIRGHRAVSDVVVTVRGAGRNGPRLVAYVVYQNGDSLTTTEVRRHVRRLLPDVMVPSLIVALDSLPVTPNGKINRNALPSPFKDAQRVTSFEAPAPGLESQIAAIWQRLLDVGRVGANDNFFELGGHSLLALRAVAAVESATGLRANPRSMFFNSLRQIAGGLRRHEAERAAGAP